MAIEHSAANSSAASFVATVLREEILTSGLAEGERLLQDATASRFGVSQMVVREAFQELLFAGFLVAEPRRGVRVAQLDAMSAQETTVLRSLLEPCLFNAAIPHMTKDDFDKADTILDAIDAGGSIDEKLILSASFHDLLYARANRERFAGVVRQLRASFERYLRLPIVDDAFARRSHREHEEILACCREQRASEGAIILREHILATGAMIVGYLQNRT